AKSAIAAEYPGMFVTPEQTAYGRDVWGLCLGSTEVAAFRTATHPVGRLGCEKTGINVLSVPLAEGVELSVGSRAAMRPEVRRYVDLTLTGVAARSAALVDRRPLSAARLAASRATFRRFAAEERAAGTVPIIG
ncbi:MAG: hypothetical protein JWN41_459, partial [Thermoleophilia bacterium]|nr:hypothetical protein [Thermoleophilia bacterium]